MLRAAWTALVAHPALFAAVTAAVAALNVLAPVAILSAVRKPLDYYTINPWLRRLPEYLASDDSTWGEKLSKLSDLALFWFSAGSSYGGAEWGFAVDVKDAARILLVSALFGLYFALWREYRVLFTQGSNSLRGGGIAGSAVTVLGVSTGACSVTGCGAPVLPVLALAFVGLESGTLHFLAQASRVATLALLAALLAAIGYLCWKATPATAPRVPPTRRAA